MRRIFVTCPKGIQPFLKAEILAAGLAVISEDVAGVLTEGVFYDAVRLNLTLRTGHRVLILLKEFIARDSGELYNRLSEIEWEDYISEDGYVCVTSNVDNPTVSDSRYANLKCKDAVVDRIREKCGRRPDSGPERDRAVVHVRWIGDRCWVYIDTSGEPLSRRGYRKIPLRAPMQETLAAAVIMATEWEGGAHFVNPMCGSGTLAIEAAMIGLRRAPGLLRSNYGFMHLKGFDGSLLADLRRELKGASEKNLRGRIIASDISREAVAAAKKNALTAGVEHLIEFSVCDYAETPVPGGGGVIILNPGYGERMGEVEELAETYHGIGDFFKKKCSGYKGYIFTGNPGLAKKVGLRPKKRTQFFNAGIECRLLEYELYEGSRRRGHGEGN